MKSILQENKRFLLEERFILNEETLLEAQATLEQLLRDLKAIETNCPELLKFLPTGITFDVPAELGISDPELLEIQGGCADVQELLEANGRFGKLIDKIREKAKDSDNSFTENEIKILEPLCYTIASDINSLKDCLKNMTNKKGDIKQQVSVLRERAPQLAQNINKLYNLVTNATTGPALNKTELQLAIGETFKLRFKTAPKKASEFKSDNPAVVKVGASGIIKAFKAGTAKITVTADGQELTCKVTVKETAGGPTTNTEINTAGGIDWKTKLASAVNKENIIEEFIYTTWPEEAEKVINIKSALLQECESYGFLSSGKQVNPFIPFISKIYLNTAYDVNPEKYNVIHNLVAKGFLTGKDLLGQGELRQGNLVFCKALYKLNAGAIKLYINKQYNLLRAAQKPDSFTSNAEMTFNILYKVANTITGRERTTQNVADMPLRSMVELEQLEAKWVGSVSNTSNEKPTNKTATNAALIQQINTSDNAVKVLAALAVKFSSTEELTKTVQSCKEARALMTKTTTLNDIRKLAASVERLYKIESITSAQALSLAKSILESDQFTLTLE